MVKRNCEGTWKLSTCQPRSQCFSLLFYLLFFRDWNAVFQYHTIQCLLIFCSMYHRQPSVCFTEASRFEYSKNRVCRSHEKFFLWTNSAEIKHTFFVHPSFLVHWHVHPWWRVDIQLSNTFEWLSVGVFALFAFALSLKSELWLFIKSEGSNKRVCVVCLSFQVWTFSFCFYVYH